MIHTFAGNKLDRADALRRDEKQLQMVADRADSRYLPFCKLNVLVQNSVNSQLGWIKQQVIAALDIDLPPVLLGLSNGIAHFAIDVSGVDEPIAALALDSVYEFKDCRVAAMELPAEDTALLAQSRSQLDWHSNHRYCSRCGEPTKQAKGGHVRRCAACKSDHFPRTDPVVIMLISVGDRALLGQSAGRMANSKMYSTLAGFIDQGESIEEAVRREIREESGIEVGEVSYHSSQPWPFPSSLMIGCHGEAKSTEITIDTVEMADVRWFSREEVANALNNQNKSLRLPPPLAIAHHLIKSWIEDGNLM